MAKWSFLTHHAVVLSFIAHHPCITARELSMHIGTTERTVRRIIKDLETGGYLRKEKEGRTLRYSIRKNLPLRRKAHRDKSVGDLLSVLGVQFREKAI